MCIPSRAVLTTSALLSCAASLPPPARNGEMGLPPLACRLRLVRHRRVVQEDAHLAIRHPLVAKGVLDLGLLARRGAREIIVAHGDGHVAVERDLVVVVHAPLPALAAVDREAAVLFVAA